VVVPGGGTPLKGGDRGRGKKRRGANIKFGARCGGRIPIECVRIKRCTPGRGQSDPRLGKQGKRDVEGIFRRPVKGFGHYLNSGQRLSIKTFSRIKGHLKKKST